MKYVAEQFYIVNMLVQQCAGDGDEALLTWSDEY